MQALQQIRPTRGEYAGSELQRNGLSAKELNKHMDKLIKYFRDTAAELKQVSWPTQHQAMLYTALVIAISIVVAIYIGLFDYAFSKVIKFVTNLS